MQPHVHRWIAIALGCLVSAQIAGAQAAHAQAAPFDRLQFVQAVRGVQSRQQDCLECRWQVQRKDGLRFLIELSDPSRAWQFFNRLRELLSVKIDARRLFPRLAERGSFPKLGLDRFWEVIVSDVAFQDLEEQGINVFDVAYFLRDELGEPKIEPDIPFGFFAPMSGWLCGSHDARTADRAWPLRETNAIAGTMNIEAAWNYARQRSKPAQGRGIRIAHLDTGVAAHDDLKPGQENIDEGCGYNTLDQASDCTDPLDYGGPGLFPGHGLSTASVMVSRGAIGMEPQSGQEGGTQTPGTITGVAPEATLVPIRCIRSVICIFSAAVVQAVDYAVALQPPEEIHVISMSLGGIASAALKTAIDLAVAQNIIVVAAAGNYSGWVVAPASFPGCIAVAASDVNAKMWPWSARGPQVDFAAPGQSVWRALRNGPGVPPDTVGRACGTSLSTAETAGAAALWLAHHGRNWLVTQLVPGQTLQDMFRQAVRISSQRPAGWDTANCGSGIIDAGELLRTPVSTIEPSGRRPNQPDNIGAFSYLDYLTGVMGPERYHGIRYLLCRTFRMDWDPGEISRVLETYGAEVTFLLYTREEIREPFEAAVDDPSDSRLADRFTAALMRFSSSRLAERLRQGR